MRHFILIRSISIKYSSNTSGYNSYMLRTNLPCTDLARPSFCSAPHSVAMPLTLPAHCTHLFQRLLKLHGARAYDFGDFNGTNWKNTYVIHVSDHKHQKTHFIHIGLVRDGHGRKRIDLYRVDTTSLYAPGVPGQDQFDTLPHHPSPEFTSVTLDLFDSLDDRRQCDPGETYHLGGYASGFVLRLVGNFNMSLPPVRISQEYLEELATVLAKSSNVHAMYVQWVVRQSKHAEDLIKEQSQHRSMCPTDVLCRDWADAYLEHGPGLASDCMCCRVKNELWIGSVTRMLSSLVAWQYKVPPEPEQPDDEQYDQTRRVESSTTSPGGTTTTKRKVLPPNVKFHPHLSFSVQRTNICVRTPTREQLILAHDSTMRRASKYIQFRGNCTSNITGQTRNVFQTSVDDDTWALVEATEKEQLHSLCKDFEKFSTPPPTVRSPVADDTSVESIPQIYTYDELMSSPESL